MQCRILCTSEHPIEASANKNDSIVLPLYFLQKNVSLLNFIYLTRSTLHTHLKEHSGVSDGITIHPGDESWEFVFSCSMYDR
jgi:hypothetical protein